MRGPRRTTAPARAACSRAIAGPSPHSASKTRVNALIEARTYERPFTPCRRATVRAPQGDGVRFVRAEAFILRSARRDGRQKHSALRSSLLSALGDLLALLARFRKSDVGIASIRIAYT